MLYLDWCQLLQEARILVHVYPFLRATKSFSCEFKESCGRPSKGNASFVSGSCAITLKPSYIGVHQ